MKGLSTTSIIIALLLSAFTFSCGSSKDNVNNASNANGANRNSTDVSTSINDNIEDLKALIAVPFEPDEVVWRTFPEGPNGKRLIAVFRLTPENARSFAARMGSSGPGRSVQSNVEQWYPAELIAMSETTGEMSVAATSYPATEFFQPPYNTGSVTIIPETDYVILELKEK